MFVRLTGCQLRCVWCDSAHAFHDGASLTVEDVVRRVAAYACRLVEITGGEPLLQPAAIPLMRRLLDDGYEVLLETSGSLPLDAVPAGVRRIVDVKCPGSGEAQRNLWDNLRALRAGDELKFVLAGREDFDWAIEQIRARGLDGRVPLLFSPVHGVLDPARLARWILEAGTPARVQIQLHKVLWPGVERGV